MPRNLRFEFPVPSIIRLRSVSCGAASVMSRGDRREDIFLDDVDRQDFIKTLAEACQKTGWQVHYIGIKSAGSERERIGAPTQE